MTEFNLNRYQTLKNLYDEETQVGEHQETGELLISPTNKNFKFSIKNWCDNLENIIKDEM